MRKRRVHDPQHRPHRRGEVHRLRPVRRSLPRRRHRNGRRQGAASARRLLRRPGRLPARLPRRRHQHHPAGSGSLRRGGGDRQPDGAGQDEGACGHARNGMPRLDGEDDRAGGELGGRGRRGSRIRLRRGRRCREAAFAPGAMARADQARSRQRALLHGSGSADRRRLLRVRLRQLPRGFHRRAHLPCRLPQARRRRLRGEARRDLRGQRHPLHHRHPYGGSLLRRPSRPTGASSRTSGASPEPPAARGSRAGRCARRSCRSRGRQSA